MTTITQDWDGKVTVSVEMKEGKFPYIEDVNLEIIEEGRYTAREEGRPVYVSGRLVHGGKIVFERINPIAVRLKDAQIIRTEKGTLVIKHAPGATLYVIEIPSGFRGGVYTEVEGECLRSTILRSPRGSIGEIAHIWVNGGNCRIRYKITGRTYTAGYEFIQRIFHTMEGKIILQDGQVRVVFDEELEKLLGE